MWISEFINEFSEAMAGPDVEELLSSVLPSLKKSNLIDSESVVSDSDYLIESIREYSEDKILRVDAECIDSPEEYSGLFSQLIEGASLTEKIDEFDIKVDMEKVTLYCRVGKDEYSKIWEQQDDWISPEFFDFINDIFQNSFSSAYARLSYEDQSLELIIIDSEIAKNFEILVASNDGVYQLDPDEVTGFKVMAVWFFCFVMMILSVVVGWYFLGFWASFGVSFLFWAIMAAYFSFSVVIKNNKDKELNKAIIENPELIGQAAVKIMKDFKSGKI